MRVVGASALAVATMLWVGACGATPTLTSTEAAPAETTEVPPTSTLAPSGVNDFSAIEDALADAEARWAESGPAAYRLTIVESVNYWVQGCSWTIDVADGIATQVPTDPAPSNTECGEAVWTVEDLHEQIRQLLADVTEFADPAFGEHTLDVEFDSLGVPTSIEFDLANGADEELSRSITFTPTP
jgi:hypothetical protein